MLLPTKQSAYRKYHATEFDLLAILSDVHTAADAGQVTLLGLTGSKFGFWCYWSTAYWLIDCVTLLGFLERFLISYLTDRTHYVYFNGASSNIIPLVCGVPRSFSAGTTVLYSVYWTHHFDCWRIRFHCAFICRWSTNLWACQSVWCFLIDK